MNRKHEMARRDIWVRAWCSVAATPSAPKASTATLWADLALAEFDERFSSLPLDTVVDAEPSRAPFKLKVRRKL